MITQIKSTQEDDYTNQIGLSQDGSSRHFYAYNTRWELSREKPPHNNISSVSSTKIGRKTTRRSEDHNIGATSERDIASC